MAQVAEQSPKTAERVSVVKSWPMGRLFQSQSSHVVLMRELMVSHTVADTAKPLKTRPKQYLAIAALEGAPREWPAAAFQWRLSNGELVAKRLKLHCEDASALLQESIRLHSRHSASAGYRPQWVDSRHKSP